MEERLNEIYELLSEKIITWYELAIKGIPNLVVACLVMFFFYSLAKVSKKFSKKFLPKISKNRSVTNLLETIIFFLFITLGLFIALGILKLDKTVTSLLAGAGVIGLAIGFAFQEIASNFFSGILIAFTEPYQIGDIVEVGEFTGEVTKIQLRTTSITTFQGLEVLVPNKDMFTKAFTNFTTTPRRRIDLTVGISYSDDLVKARDLVVETLQDISERIKNEEVKVFFTEFGSSSINFNVHLWVEYPGHQSFLQARSDAIIKIKKAFDREGITIPFPIRTLDFPKQAQLKIEKLNHKEKDE